MPLPFDDAVTTASRLTRAGDPLAATRVLQEALNGRPADAAAAANRTALASRPAGNDTTAPSPETSGDAMATSLRDALKTLTGKSRRATRPLGETIARLRGLRRTRPEQTPPPPAPAGASFAQAQYATAEGARPYKLYVPARPAAPGERGLIVMLHGCTQDPDDFATGTRMNALAEEHGFLVVYPQQVAGANQMVCWNWFQPSHQGFGRGEPAIIAGLAQEIALRHGVDRDRIYAAGLSAGGAMAAILGAAYPELFAAVGVHSGLPVGAARDVASAFAAMRDGAGARAVPRRAVRTIVFHGAEDTTVAPANGALVAGDALAGLGGGRETMEAGQAAGGRAYTRRIVRDGAGAALVEHWTVQGAGHAWSGGDASGSYADPHGPDASREMVRFFLS